MPTAKKPAGKAGKGSAGKKPAKSDKTMTVAAEGPHKPKSK
jgi:hypothetical protein